MTPTDKSKVLEVLVSGGCNHFSDGSFPIQQACRSKSERVTPLSVQDEGDLDEEDIELF
jgi:hypothetical protein